MTEAAGVVVEPWENGAAFQVKARPGGRRNAITGSHAGLLRAEVTAAPEKGRANQALIRLLAEKLETPAANLALLRGETATRKRFGVRGMAPERLAAKLRALLGQADGAGKEKP